VQLRLRRDTSYFPSWQCMPLMISDGEESDRKPLANDAANPRSIIFT